MPVNTGFTEVYRAVPLVAAVVCVGFGTYILRQERPPDYLTAGLTMFQFALICLALYANAATVLWQQNHPYGGVGRYIFPIFAWLMVIVALGYSVWLMNQEITDPVYFTLGHVTFAMAVVCFCIAAVVSASAHFPQLIVPVLTTLVCFVLSAFLYESGDSNLITGARLLVGLGLVAYPVWSIVSVMQAHGEAIPVPRRAVADSLQGTA